VPSATSIPLTSAAGFAVGQQVYIALAGAVSGTTTANYTGTITAISGQTLTVSPAITTAPPVANALVWTLGTTTGSISASSTALTVANSASYYTGQGIYIAGAGASGGAYIGAVGAVNSSTSITVSPAASTQVSGAVVQHDDTNAFQSAINAVAGNGGGKIVVPDGFYQINGPLQDTGTGGANAIINMPKLPALSAYSGTGTAGPMVGVSIQGVTLPYTLPNTFVTQTLPNMGGTIIYTAQTAGNLIGGVNLTQAGDFTGIALDLENLIFRTQPNPQITMVNAKFIDQLKVVQCVFDTSDTGLVTQPTNSNGVALITPEVTDNVNNRIQDTVIWGYYTGLSVGEMIELNDIWIHACAQPMVLQQYGYGVHGAKIAIQASPQGIIAGAGARNIIFDQVNFEHATTPSWVTNVYDINDPSNYLSGRVTYERSGGTINVNGAAGLSLQLNAHPFPFSSYEGTTQGHFFAWPTIYPQAGQMLQITGAGPTVGGQAAMQSTWVNSVPQNLVTYNMTISNGRCTAAGVPYTCCTGSGTGTCPWPGSGTNTTLTPNDASDSVFTPEGAYNGTSLKETSATGAHNYIGNNGPQLVTNYDYTATVFVKAIPGSARDLLILDNSSGNGQWFSLSNANCTASATPWSCCTGSGTGSCYGKTQGVYGNGPNANSSCTGSATPYSCCTGAGTGTCPGQAGCVGAGNYWYKCSITTTCVGGAMNFGLYLSKGTSISYAGTSGAGVYLFKPQMVQGDVPAFFADSGNGE
jgi:hypothetical protein